MGQTIKPFQHRTIAQTLRRAAAAFSSTGWLDSQMHRLEFRQSSRNDGSADQFESGARALGLGDEAWQAVHEALGEVPNAALERGNVE